MKAICKILPAAAIAASLLAGCGGDSDGLKGEDAANSSEMKAAISAERLGNYEEAIALYQATIDNYKSAPLAHLQLALLLHEYRRDYLPAIYHYRRYIETASSASARDFSIISNRIEKVEQLLSAKYIRTIAESEASESVQLMKNYADLDQKVSLLNRKNTELVATNELLKTEISRLNSKIDGLLVWISKIQDSPTGGSPSAGRLDSVTVTDENGNTRVLQTYEVKKGDSLSLIAEIVYNDRTLWPRIRDANLDKIKNGDRVKPGDILIIP